MTAELDHVFICVARGAPEREHLVRFGLTEGDPNVHPGQGTANTRFFFMNAMLELLWVENESEARSRVTAPTQLWQRWSGRGTRACPFGIILRPANIETAAPPFPAQEYRPAWLPPDLQIYIAPAVLEEPMWVFMPFLRRSHHEQRFVAHPAGVREITRLTLATPIPPRSPAARVLFENEILYLQEGPDYLLTIQLDHGSRSQSADFRPHLPLVFHF